MEDFTTFVCYVMKGTMKKLEKYIGQRLEEHGVNMAQSFILFALMENNGITLTEIGSRTQIENSSLTTMVDRLEKEGLVERRLDAQDRRVIRIFITPGGSGLGQRVLDEGRELNRYLQDNLEGAGDQFLKSLEKISQSLDLKK